MKKILSIITISLFAGAVSAQTAYTLDELKKLATDSSAEMLTARNNIEAARHQKKEAFTNYFPQVSASCPQATTLMNSVLSCNPPLGFFHCELTATTW